VAGARPGPRLVMLGDVAQEPHRVATILDAATVAPGRGGSLAPPRLGAGRLASPPPAPGCLRALRPGSCRLAALTGAAPGSLPLAVPHRPPPEQRAGRFHVLPLQLW